MSTDIQNKKLTELPDRLRVSAALLSDPAGIAFFTGLEFPFAAQFPDKPVACLSLSGGGSFLFCPYEWGRAAEDQGWKNPVHCYGDGHAAPFDFLATEIADIIGRSGGSVGYDEEHLSSSFLESLEEICPGAAWKPCGTALREARLVKSPEEAALLQSAAEQLEFGLIGALQHLEGSLEENGYTLAEFCERIRVHVYEMGGTAFGLAAAAAGKGGTRWYARPEGKFVPGELVRIEATSRYMGAWANTSRMVSIGKADDLQKRAYVENLLLKKAAEALLAPGVVCADLFAEVAGRAAAEGIALRREFGAGHGIGTAEMEAPFLDGYDGTVLREGMCILLGIYTEGPRKELICTKDTYVLTAAGARCVSSFHNWDVLYEVDGFRSAH